MTGIDTGISYEHTVDPHPTAWQSAAAAWSGVADSATHHLVVQDDVELCANFVDVVHEAARMFPDCAVSFFAEWGCKTASLIRVAALMGAGWVEGVDKYVHTQVLLLPAAAARALGRHLSAHDDHSEPEDVLVLRFLRQEGLRHLVPSPNLAQHRDLPSLTGNTWQGPRLSVQYDPAGALPPGATVEGVPVLPFYQWRAGKTWLLVRNGTDADEWHRESLSPVLKGLGWSGANTVDTLREVGLVMSDLPPGPAGHLAGVVEMAVGITMTAAALAPVDRLSFGPGSPADQAFATLGDGALRALMSPGELDAVRGPVRAAVGNAVRAAMMRLAEGGLGPLGR